MLLRISKSKSISMFAMCLCSFNLLSQAIVNIEDLRREGQIGFFTNISASLDAVRGNSNRDFYSAQIRFDNNSEDAESFLILKQTERKSNDEVISESSFMHGRYILVGKEAVHWELFAQYSENPFRNYKKRSVLGGGLRYELSQSARLGAGFLSEDETDLAGQAKTTERLGFYVHNSFKVAENIAFRPTIYFQPSLDDFENDYKTSIIFSLDFMVNKNFNIKMQYLSSYDSDPPILAKNKDESISTMFSYNLN